MRYAGWNLEKTLLIDERACIRRDREPVDVRLSIAGERAGNIARDVRVVLKRDWNVLGPEIPCQVHRVERHGGTTTFRVAFTTDLAAGARQRVGVLYDNPSAAAADHPSDLDVQGEGLGRRIVTPFYVVQTDPDSGQIRSIAGKIDDQGATVFRRLTPPDRAQEGVAVVFALPDGDACRAVAVSAADWRRPEIVDESRGPVFFKQARRGRLVPPGGDPDGPWPELEIACKFFAEQPWFLVHSRLAFPADTKVFGIYTDVMTLAREPFSHYTFRPVSPSLPLTDVEEMGHILVDPAYTSDLPDGLAFSDLLPHDLAWHALINIHRHRQHAIAGVQLVGSMAGPDDGRGARRPAVTYRPATYLVRQGNAVQWFRAPVYVHVRDRMDNAITVPGGTVIEDLNAVCFSDWDQQWGQRIDALGRRLNNPPLVTDHPLYLGAPVSAEADQPLEPVARGRRADAYLRAGVR